MEKTYNIVELFSGIGSQAAALKNLGVKWRNSAVRSDISVGKVDENRLIVSYTIPLM